MTDATARVAVSVDADEGTLRIDYSETYSPPTMLPVLMSIEIIVNNDSDAFDRAERCFSKAVRLLGSAIWHIRPGRSDEK